MTPVELYEETKLNLKKQGYNKEDIFRISSDDFEILILEKFQENIEELSKLKGEKWIFKESKYHTVPEILNKGHIKFYDENNVQVLLCERTMVYDPPKEGKVKMAKRKKRIKEIETELERNKDYIIKICMKGKIKKRKK